MNSKNFTKGALIGCCLGGITALLMAPKLGKGLREDIEDGYNSISEQASSYTDEIQDKAQNFKNNAQKYFEGDSEQSNSTMCIVGALGGVALGSIAALLLAPESGADLRQHIGDQYDSLCDKTKKMTREVKNKGQQYEEKLVDWKDTLVEMLEKLPSNAKKATNHGLSDVIDWAKLGMQFFQHLQERK